MSVSTLFHRESGQPLDPRAVPCLIALIELRHHPERGDASYPRRLETLSDGQISELAGDPVAHRWMGRAKIKELLCALARRQLDFDCLDPAFITILKETTRA